MIPTKVAIIKDKIAQKIKTAPHPNEKDNKNGTIIPIKIVPTYPIPLIKPVEEAVIFLSIKRVGRVQTKKT